jgi:hydrogenase maturation factor
VLEPDVAPGAYVLVHLGLPVEVLDAKNAHDMLALRQNTESEEEEVHP